MHFITLTSNFNEPITVNFSKICALVDHSNCTSIIFGSSNLVVKENLTQIQEKITKWYDGEENV
jgi:hypothetical protein